MSDVIYIDNDNDVVIGSLRLSSDEASFVNDATITADLNDSSGVVVVGADDVSIPYIAASDGNYRGTIPGTITLVENAMYTLVITSSNYNLGWEKRYKAVKRDC